MTRQRTAEAVEENICDAFAELLEKHVQVDVAAMLGISQTSVSAMKRGRVSFNFSGLSLLRRLSDVTGRSLDDLVGRPNPAAEKLRALVAALPQCCVCGEPATHETRQRYPFCREHADDGCSELPWATALEAVR